MRLGQPTKAENGEEQVPKGIWELVVDEGEKMDIGDVINQTYSRRGTLRRTQERWWDFLLLFLLLLGPYISSHSGLNKNL